MEKEIYTYIKEQINEQLPEILTVGLFNNQFQRLSADKVKQNSFGFPAVFIEFGKSNFRDLSQGVQEFDLTITTHLGFESYKNEDTDILDLKQELYFVMQRLQTGYFSRLSRVAESQDFDHDNTQVFTTEYETYSKDYTKDIRNTTQVTVTAETTTTIVSGYTF